jgi:hypothetical protein
VGLGDEVLRPEAPPAAVASRSSGVEGPLRAEDTRETNMKNRLRLLAAATVGVPLALILGAPAPASADLPGAQQLGVLASLDVTTLIPADDPALTDPAANESATADPPHLPKGGKYKLFGTAKDDLDPQNAFNEVISFDTTDPNAIAGAYRKLGDHVQLGMLTNQVELKYYLVGRTCGGGSPRIQLGLDLNGDGKFDINAFGYLGDMAFGGGCVMNKWVYEDMTDSAPKWETSQLPVTDPCRSFTDTWSLMVSCITAEYPNHRVVNAVLVDDSGSFFVGDRGCAYFDLVSTGGRTLTGWDDTSDGGKQTNNC